MKKLLTSLFAGVATLAMAAPAFAYNSWNSYVGNIWISQWTVERTSNDGTTVFIDVSMPTCGSATQLKGSVGIDYYGPNGGYMTGYTVNAYGYEGYDGWLSVTSPYKIGLEGGSIYVTDDTYCGSLDVAHPDEWDVNDIDWDPTNWF